MKILLTGSNGFLGRNLLQRLNEQGIKIIRFSRKESSMDMDYLNLIDIRKLEIKFDILIHAGTCYGRSGEGLNELYYSNVTQPIELTEYVLLNPSASIINIDTVVNDPLNHYSVSKKLYADYLKSKFVGRKCINLRLEHIYGVDYDQTKFLTYVTQRLLHNLPLNLTKGEQHRDFIYIDDVVYAILTIVNNMRSVESKFISIGCGSGEAYKIKDLIMSIAKVTNSKSDINFDVIEYRKNELMYSKANNETLKSLGWHPKIEINNGIAKLIKAYK